MNKTLLPFILLLTVWGCKPSYEAIQTRTASNAAAVASNPYVILVSIDGFRHDYAEKYGAKHITALGKEGVVAEAMIPSFPSSTFPNHYTLVTGLYPGNHGLVSNTFIDPIKNTKYTIPDKTQVRDGSYYGGTPLWVLAEKQDMRTASFFWVGSEADIQGEYPTWYYDYDSSIPGDDRVDQVIDWLKLPEEKRPHFITLYFSDVDSKGHKFGPDSPEVGAAVQDADEWVGDLHKRVKKLNLPVNIIITSDHGMQQVDRDHPVILAALTDLSNYDMAASGGVICMLYAKDKAPEKIEATYQELVAKADGKIRVYRSAEVPDSLHFPASPRTGDLVIFTEAPNAFGTANWKPSPGCHGFDPYATPDIHTIFYANGPAFKQGKTIPPFRNIHVFPLLTEILGLEYDAGTIDGDIEVLKGILN